MLVSKINNWLQSSFRLVLTIVVCGLLFISSVSPAQAASSKATDGEASLSGIQAKTDNVAKSNPRGINKVTKEAEKGLNAVQGSADKNKMISSENSDATTIKEKAANILSNLTD